MTFWLMVTYQGGVQRGIKHVPSAWVINRRSGYKVEYPSWDIDAIFQRTTCGVEVGYTMERSLCTLKQYVHNKVRPKGSIAEAYVMNESSTFCSCYLSGIETRFTRDERNDDTIPEDEEEKHLFYYYILNNVDETSEYRNTMSSFLSGFDKTDVMVLNFTEDLDNLTGGSSLVGDNSTGTTQPSTTSTPKRRAQAISVCLRKTFPVCCLKWTDIGREYIKVVKGDLQHFFVLDFNDQAMNRFVEHQMLSTFKESQAPQKVQRP
ncbi:CACTA en-spm transposon protein [Cucumis melo var. makuwa]|uniref:CACTA en-spm transposon protein n=1 Tax=Cucumis melo var. makuwa TaxID=1194695 RepID=A0A5D3BD67_CUCMM|nr:CACTA en-spm transposon protein [Cucumis melo var. makuwa]